MFLFQEYAGWQSNSAGCDRASGEVTRAGSQGMSGFCEAPPSTSWAGPTCSDQTGCEAITTWIVLDFVLL